MAQMCTQRPAMRAEVASAVRAEEEEENFFLPYPIHHNNSPAP